MIMVRAAGAANRKEPEMSVTGSQEGGQDDSVCVQNLMVPTQHMLLLCMCLHLLN